MLPYPSSARDCSLTPGSRLPWGCPVRCAVRSGRTMAVRVVSTRSRWWDMASIASCSEPSISASTIARCSRLDCSRRPPSSLRNADWRASASRISSMTRRKTGFWAACGDGEMEERVHRHPRGGVGLLLHPVQQVGEVVEVLGGTAHRRVAGDRDLHVAADLQQVARRVVAEGGVLDGAVGDDEGALAGARDGQPHRLQGPQRLPQHGSADLQAAAQLRLGGQLVPHGVLAALDGAAQMTEHRFHRADAPRDRASCLAV